MSLAAPISPSFLPSGFSSTLLLSYQGSSQGQSKSSGSQGSAGNSRKRGSAAASSTAGFPSSCGGGSDTSSDSSRPTKFPRLAHQVMFGATASSSGAGTSSSASCASHHLPYVRSLKRHKEQRERTKSFSRGSSSPVASSSKLLDFPCPFPINSNGDPAYPSWVEHDLDPFALTETLPAETPCADGLKTPVGPESPPNRCATPRSSSTCTDAAPSLPVPPISKPIPRSNCRPSLSRNPSLTRPPICPSPLSRDTDGQSKQSTLADASPTPLDSRLQRPRTKPEPNLLKQAIKTRMLATPEGKKILHMGARLAVSIGEATKELERIVKESQARERDLERSLSACPVDAVDWDGDTVMMDETCSVAGLSKSWIVIAGEDWEMVDCAA